MGTRQHTSPRHPLLSVTLIPARCHLLGRRWHHGTTGLLLLTVRRLRYLGLALIVHDIRDRREWLPALVRHPECPPRR